MKKVKQLPKVKYTYVIGAILLLVVTGFAYFITNPDKITNTKNDCDKRFLEWCEVHSNGVDYDNFAVENRDCTGSGTYRTCGQVSEALS